MQVSLALALYPRLAVVVEWARPRPGERSSQGVRTKHMDPTAAQLGAAGVRVLYSQDQVQTAVMVAELVKGEVAAGAGLPRDLRPTVWQEEMVAWLLRLPGVGLGAALLLAATFPTLRQVVIAPAAALEQRACLPAAVAAQVAAACGRTFRPGLTDMAPLI